MLPFCNNGWRVFVDISDECISYGITRNFNGPSGLNLVDILADLEESEREALNVNFALIDITNSFEIQLRSYDTICKIDFRLLEESSFDDDRAKETFCHDILAACPNEDKRSRIAYKKIVDLFSQKLHGSICFVIKNNHTLPDEVFDDGIFLDTPIDIYTVLSEDLNKNTPSLNSTTIISSHEKYHALTGVLLEMLNIDGITIIDDKGRIRAFNVFIKPDTDTTAISGGARKRAASFLSKQTNTNYKGVYFQSQDGTAFYERVISE